MVLMVRAPRESLSPRLVKRVRGAAESGKRRRKTSLMMKQMRQMMNLMLLLRMTVAVMMRVTRMMLGCSATRSCSDPAGVWSTTGTESIVVGWTSLTK